MINLPLEKYDSVKVFQPIMQANVRSIFVKGEFSNPSQSYILPKGIISKIYKTDKQLVKTGVVILQIIKNNTDSTGKNEVFNFSADMDGLLICPKLKVGNIISEDIFITIIEDKPAQIRVKLPDNNYDFKNLSVVIPPNLNVNRSAIIKEQINYIEDNESFTNLTLTIEDIENNYILPNNQSYLKINQYLEDHFSIYPTAVITKQGKYFVKKILNETVKELEVRFISKEQNGNVVIAGDLSSDDALVKFAELSFEKGSKLIGIY